MIIVPDSSRARRAEAGERIIPARLNIVNKSGEEAFEISVRRELFADVDLSVLEVLPRDRHLVLLSKHIDADGAVLSKDHFLCGHDERHLFVASVDSVSTVAAAKASLKPAEIRDREFGLDTRKRNRRKTKLFVRQGEWFFVSADINPDPNLVLRYEPLIRNFRSKPHIAQFAYRFGGENVRVCTQYPEGLTMPEYETLIADNPRARHFNWRNMRRNPRVYVKGSIRHADHATVVLDTWHRVLLNAERLTEAVTFLD